jgi:hypothetical protein
MKIKKPGKSPEILRRIQEIWQAPLMDESVSM